MHSHERTLLASLGFADSDKKDRRHDLACQYLSEPANAMALLKHIDAERPYRTDWAFGNSEYEVVISKGEGKYRTHIGFMDIVLTYKHRSMRAELHSVAPYQSDLERILCNIPRSIDLILEWHADGVFELAWDNHAKQNPAALLRATEEIALHREAIKEVVEKSSWAHRIQNFIVPVEVKIRPVQVGDIMRQVELYRTYYSPDRYKANADRWVVATAFAMDPQDTKALRDKGIFQIRLGKKFDEYCSHREQASTGGIEAPEL